MKMFRTVMFIFIIYLTILKIVITAPTNHFTKGPHIFTISKSPKRRATPFVEVQNSTSYGAGPREEAHAICSVRTNEVNATANATITRRLHGVVTSKELQSSLHRLEVIIYGQMQQLWRSLDALRAQLGGGSYTPYPDRRTVSFRYTPIGL